MEKLITYCQQPAKIGCDEKCNKAWGSAGRPKIQLSDNEDDYVFLADGELGEAPVNPGTYEGEHAKPLTLAEAPNKWCARACERLSMSKPGESDQPLKLKDFSRRRYNFHSRQAEADAAEQSKKE